MKRILAMMLTAVLALSTAVVMPVSASYAADVSYDNDNVKGIYYGSGSRTGLCVYNDEVFTGDSEVYDPQLALMSVSLAYSSVNSKRYPDESYKYLWMSKNAREFLEDNGFSDIYVNDDYKVKPDGTKAAAAFARKTIRDGGRDYTLIAIVPKGGAFEAEFRRIGEAGKAEGDSDDFAYFVDMRDRTLKSARKYIRSCGISGDVKLWIPGYSRSGGVANLVAAAIIDDPEASLGSSVKVSGNDIYCYCLSTYKAAAVSKDPGADRYRTIHNIVNEDDIVINLPWEKMSFTWYGQAHDLRAGEDKAEAMRLLEARSRSDYESFIDGEDPDSFYPMKLDIRALLQGKVSLERDDDSYLPYELDEFIDSALDPLIGLFAENAENVRDGYYRTYQKYIENILTCFVEYGLPETSSLLGSRTAIPFLLSTYLSFIAEKSADNSRIKVSELNASIEDTFNALAYNIEDENGELRSDLVRLKGTAAAYKLIRRLYFTENETVNSNENGIPDKYSLRREISSDSRFAEAVGKLSARLYSMTMSDILSAQGVDSKLISKITSEEESAAVSRFLAHVLFGNERQSGRIRPLDPENEQFKELATLIGNYRRCASIHFAVNDLAWLEAATGLYGDFEGLTDPQLAGYRRVYINKAPDANIEGIIRDESGSVAATFRNGSISSRTDKWIGYTKSDNGGWLRLPLDKSYTVEMKSDIDSKLDIILAEYSVTEGEIKRNVSSDSAKKWTGLNAYKNGSVILDVPAVTAGKEGFALPSDVSYSVSVSGSASSVTKYSKSVPKAGSVKAKAGAGSVTVSWKKLSAKQRAKFSKVEIRYSTSKKFGSYKTVFVSKKKTSCKIKGLKKGKTYYFRVRNVRTKSGTRYVSNWSAVRKAKVK